MRIQTTDFMRKNLKQPKILFDCEALEHTKQSLFGELKAPVQISIGIGCMKYISH